MQLWAWRALHDSGTSKRPACESTICNTQDNYTHTHTYPQGYKGVSTVKDSLLCIACVWIRVMCITVCMYVCVYVCIGLNNEWYTLVRHTGMSHLLWLLLPQAQKVQLPRQACCLQHLLLADDVLQAEQHGRQQGRWVQSP